MQVGKRKAVLTLLFGTLLLAMLACSFLTGAQPQEAAIPSEVAAGESAPQTEVPAPGPIHTPTPTTAPPTPTPLPQGFSRQDPFPRNEWVSAPNWDVWVTEIMRGEQAWSAIQAANMFNEPPPQGLEYLLVKLRVRSTYADDEAHSISACDFDVTGDRRVLYSCGDSPIVEPEPNLDAELFTGGEVEGWAGFVVGIGEGNLILVVNETFNFEDQRVRYIALDQGASVGVQAELADIAPTHLGSERHHPAQRSEKVIAEDWEISVLDVIRGEGAWAMVQDANQFNDPPAEGMEYIAVKVQARYIGTQDHFATIDSSFFRSTGSLGVLYDSAVVVDPLPRLDGALFPGGEIEGWVVVQAGVGEAEMVLVFEPWYDFSGDNQRFITLE